MIRLIQIAILALPLCAFQCKGPEAEHVMSAIFGVDVAAKTALPQATGFLSVPVESEVLEVAGDDVVSVAAVEPEPEPVVIVEPTPEPEPPSCDNWTWRGRVFDCHGNWLYDL